MTTVDRAVDRPGLWKEMDAAGLDSLIVYGVDALAQYGAFAYATGARPANKGAYALVRPGESPLVLTITARADTAARRNELEPLMTAASGRVGVATGSQGLPPGDREMVAGHLAGRFAGDVTTLLDELRRTADERDERELRATARVLEGALAAVESEACTGDTELEIAARIRAAITREGAQTDIVQVSAVFTGAPPSERRIAEGESVTVFAEASRAGGHWVEVGGIFLAGGVDGGRVRAAEAVVAALADGADQLREGSTTAEVIGAMKARTEPIGRRTIGWGHAVGVDEGPLTLHEGEDLALAARQVFALHPSAVDIDRAFAIAAAGTFIVGTRPLSDHPYRLRTLRRP